MDLRKYAKTIAALIAALGVIASFAADGEFSQNDIAGSVSALAGVYAVFQVRNKPDLVDTVTGGKVEL